MDQERINWVKVYYDRIRSGEEVVSAKVRLVYKRETEFMDDPDLPYVFDLGAACKPIEFIERFCRHYKGKWAGKRIELEIFQKAKIQLAYGWLEKATGHRRFRDVVDVRARKTGKSTETAAVELFSLIADDEGGAEIYCVANKKDQARIIYNAAVAMRAQSPSLRGITKKRQSDIYYPATMSVLEALASDTDTMDGLNAHFFAFDEWHATKTRKIYDVMKQSQSAREQPLAWLVSTNGFEREGYFDETYEYASRVALWEVQDYTMLPLIYELDSRDEWTDPAMWPKANPGLGRIKSMQALTEAVEKAKRDPSALPSLLVKDFNIPENSATGWLPYDAIVNEEVVTEEELKKSYAIGGCDLSSTTDLTCATILTRRHGSDKIYVIQKYFLPRARIDITEATPAREAPYLKWAEQGWLHICDGATVDFKAVTQWFVDMVEKYDIRPLWVGYDRALSGYWVEDMEQAGFEMVKVAQGPYTWSYPMKRLGGLFTDGLISYQNNPILRWNLLNTGVKTMNRDGVNTIQPVKTGTTKRIDGLVSLLNAFVVYNDNEDDYLRYVGWGKNGTG